MTRLLQQRVARSVSVASAPLTRASASSSSSLTIAPIIAGVVAARTYDLMGLIEQSPLVRFTPPPYPGIYYVITYVVAQRREKSGDPNRGARPLCVGNRGWSLRSVMRGRLGAFSWLRDGFNISYLPVFLVSVLLRGTFFTEGERNC